MTVPKVSIIIPTYKRSQKIARAVKSAISQKYENFEIIVVDDNDPTDVERSNTENVMKQFEKNENVSYIKHSRNMNGSAARNTGINHSTGMYVTFLDDDDEYFPDKIKKQVDVLESLDDSWGICYSGYEKIDRNNYTSYSAEVAEGDVIVQALSKNFFIGSGSNYMVRKKIVEELKGFDETFKRNQDLEFLVRVVSKYKIKYVDERLFLIHEDENPKRFTYDEIVGVYEQYRQKFGKYIESLSVEEKNNVLKVLDLSDLRLAVTYKQYKDVLNIFKGSNLSLMDVFKYVKYLATRLITKKSYGFRL